MTNTMDWPLHEVDPDTQQDVVAEALRQHSTLGMIPSTNLMSRAVIEAEGSPLANLYSEGYPGRRYYQGQVNADAVELRAIERAKSVFGVQYANVQALSGSPANFAVYAAFCKPGDPVVGMALPAGGHLTHGWNASVTGQFFKVEQYGVSRNTGLVDFEQVRQMVLKMDPRPKLIWCGGTAIPRKIDFAAFASIARECGSLLVADVSHIAGLIAGGLHPSPVEYADIITCTTHKTLGGPRGALIMWRNPDFSGPINKAVFPGLQGGPHMNTISAIGVCLKQAMKPEFRQYAQRVVGNAYALAAALQTRGYNLVTGGTDTHLLLINLSDKGISGKKAAQALERARLVCNYNTVPFDPRKPFDPSGIRLGTPGLTTRGMGVAEMLMIAEWFDRGIQGAIREDEAELARIGEEVLELCNRFPVYEWIWNRNLAI